MTARRKTTPVTAALACSVVLGLLAVPLAGADYSPTAYGRFAPDTPPLEAAATLQHALDACAAALLEAGARSVRALTAARG